MRVEAARGAMAVDGLGTTLMHEHVFVLTPDVMQNYGHEWRWDEQDRGADAVRQLQGSRTPASTRPRSRRCWSTTRPATSPEARSEPNCSYRDSPYAQPLPASGCSG